MDLKELIGKVAKPFLAVLNIYLGIYSAVLTFRQYKLNADLYLHRLSLTYAIMFMVYTVIAIGIVVTKRNHLKLLPILVLLFISYFILVRQ